MVSTGESPLWALSDIRQQGPTFTDAAPCTFGTKGGKWTFAAGAKDTR
jgi:hypothetical protein